MGGTSGEVDGMEEVDMLAVCVWTATATGGYKIINISGSIGWIDFKFGQDVADGVPYH